MAKYQLTGLVAVLLPTLILIGVQHHRLPLRFGAAEPIQLNAVLPKLEALHDEARALLIKNAELKSKILVGLQAQNEAKIKAVKASRLFLSSSHGQTPAGNQIDTEQLLGDKTNKHAQKQQHASPLTKVRVAEQQGKNSTLAKQQQHTAASMSNKQKSSSSDPSNKSMIDFNELEDFNKWVEINLEYAVKNTQASAEALKEEALHNNGTVDYSVQAINDGLEGTKYWQSAIMFQDKTLKNEKFDSMDGQ